MIILLTQIYANMSLLRSIAVVLITPTKLAFLFILVGMLLTYLGRKTLAKFFYITAAVWLLVFSQPYIADLLLHPLEHAHDKTAEYQIDTDKPILVLPLACFYQSKGNIPEVARWPECSLQRMLKAQEIAEQMEANILLTGGHFVSKREVNYSQKAKAFYIARHFPEQRLVEVGVGTSTWQELESISELSANKKLVIVTSATHGYRASEMAKKLGLNAHIVRVDYHTSGELSPYITLPSGVALVKTKHAFYEYFAILKFRLQELIGNT